MNDVVFYEPRNFSNEEFIDFIFRQSKVKKGWSNISLPSRKIQTADRCRKQWRPRNKWIPHQTIQAWWTFWFLYFILLCSFEEAWQGYFTWHATFLLKARRSIVYWWPQHSCTRRPFLKHPCDPFTGLPATKADATAIWFYLNLLIYGEQLYQFGMIGRFS